MTVDTGWIFFNSSSTVGHTALFRAIQYYRNQHTRSIMFSQEAVFSCLRNSKIWIIFVILHVLMYKKYLTKLQYLLAIKILIR